MGEEGKLGLVLGDGTEETLVLFGELDVFELYLTLERVDDQSVSASFSFEQNPHIGEFLPHDVSFIINRC